MTCQGGQIASIEIAVPSDCDCVGIARILWNTNNSFTITLTNGQSITSPVLTGEVGPAPTILFRVAGTMLQVSINGGAYEDLYDFETLVWSSVLQNTYPATSTVGAGSVETLGSKTLTAGQLATDGDELNVYAAYSTNSDVPNISRYVLFGINGSGINILGGLFAMSNCDKIELTGRISRLSATTGKIDIVVTYYSSLDGEVLFSQKATDSIAVTWANAVTIEAMAHSVVVGDITLQAFEITYGKA